MGMYSMFDLLFETPSYRPVYVISDSEMKELKKNQHQEELDEITKQKVRLEDAFKEGVARDAQAVPGAAAALAADRDRDGRRRVEWRGGGLFGRLPISRGPADQRPAGV